MENKQRQNNGRNIFLDMLFVLKKNIWLLIAVIVLATAVGGIFAKVRKPDYVAKTSINFSVKLKDTSGKTPAQINSSEINVMAQIVDTVVAFSKAESVLDRANYYFIQYKNGGTDLVEYIKSVEEEIAGGTDPYEPKYRGANSHFNSGNIKTYSSTKDDKTTAWFFTISYKDHTPEDARAKTALLALAYSVEAKDLFNDVTIKLQNMWGYNETAISYSKDIGATKILIIAFVIGVLVGLLAVYLRNLLDNTIRTKEDLERLTGVDLLANIEDKADYYANVPNDDKVKGGAV